MVDIIVVGAGFAGSVIARQLAEKYNKKVLVLEKRNHIGGNMHEQICPNGIRVHKYGPHIFHTNSSKVMNYLFRFGEWREYKHTVLGKIGNEFIPIPFNFKSIDQLFSKEKADFLKKKIIKEFSDKKKIFITDLLNIEDIELLYLGEFIYDNVFKNYTAKQWQISADKIDKSVINRVPIVLGYENGYFNDKYQFMPQNSYNDIFEALLNHPNITIEINKDALSKIRIDFNNQTLLVDNTVFNGEIAYTGELDALFKYKFGTLPYRSLNLIFEEYEKEFYQNNSVVNYPNEEKFTRITEFKYLTGQKSNKTAILKEYPMRYEPYGTIGNTPYYPIQNDINIGIYNKYLNEASRFNNLYLCGRLAEYKYYNMDQVIEKALLIADSIGEKDEKY